MQVYGVVALNWTIPNWVEHKECKYGIEDKLQKGPKVDLLIINSSKSVFVDKENDSEISMKVGW